MYKKAYGIIETLAPLHVGATAGEESGNLNFIFRDQFTQTGIVPGSSIRGRFRSEIRQEQGEDVANTWYGAEAEPDNPIVPVNLLLSLNMLQLSGCLFFVRDNLLFG